MPIIGIKSILPLTIEIIATNPPNEREPVSPIKTVALCVLKSKYPTIAPDNEKQSKAFRPDGTLPHRKPLPKQIL